MSMFLENNTLTNRELEVLSLLVEGLSNEVIAGRLSITVYTVKHHIANIYEKLNVHNKVQAAIYAVVHNLVETKNS